MIALWKAASTLASNNKVIAISVAIVLMMTASIFLLWLLISDIREGGEAIGREQAKQETTEKIDAELAARRRVLDCLNAGRVWNDAEGRCGEPAVSPISR